MYKLLIVDDEYEIRNSLSRFYPWEEAGFVVAGQATDGEEARTFLESQKIDAVLCDIRMPKVSGLEFAKWVLERGLGVKIVFLSAYRKFDFAQEALRYDVKEYLVKPPDFGELSACFKRLRDELDREREAGLRNVSDPADAVVDAVETYVKGNPGGATLREAARLVNMNSHYLSTYFRARTGRTFSRFLLGVRMERAKLLLKDRNNSVAKVSELVGYTNYKNFSRAFRTYYGSSPRRPRSFDPRSE